MSVVPSSAGSVNSAVEISQKAAVEPITAAPRSPSTPERGKNCHSGGSLATTSSADRRSRSCPMGRMTSLENRCAASIKKASWGHLDEDVVARSVLVSARVRSHSGAWRLPVSLLAAGWRERRLLRPPVQGDEQASGRSAFQSASQVFHDVDPSNRRSVGLSRRLKP